jgi:hypothetical protein
MQPQVIPERLLKLIDYQGLTITELEEKSRVSRRQIHELKAKPQPSEPVKVRKTTLTRLASALRVKPGVLSGELPLQDSDAEAAADHPRHELSAKISARTRQRYDLACHRYGVSEEELLEIAPLLLTIVAEDSLKWRRERLRKQVDMLYTMSDLLRFRGIDLFGQSADKEETRTILQAEQESIDRNELFGQTRQAAADRLDPDQYPTNPFTEYLEQKVFADLGPDFIDFDVYGDGSATSLGFPMVVQWQGENLPQFRLLSKEIHSLLDINQNGSINEDQFKALLAINQCRVSLRKLRESINSTMTSHQRATIALSLLSAD